VVIHFLVDVRLLRNMWLIRIFAGRFSAKRGASVVATFFNKSLTSAKQHLAVKHLRHIIEYRPK